MSKQSTEYCMAAVGEYETVLPFQAVGVRPFIIKGEGLSAVRETLERLAREQYAVVFVQESYYAEMADEVNQLNREHETSFVPVPGLRGSMGAGLESIRSSVERAVGMDIFQEK